MGNYDIETMPYKQARFFTDASRRKGDIRVVVIHDMEAPEKSTTAEAVASWWAGPNSSRSSAHINIDDDSAIRSVLDEDVAWHAPGANHDGLGIEIAGYARQSREEWLDAFSRKALDNAANVTAQYCLKYDLNVHHLSREELAAGHTGITSHRDVTAVYKKSTHTDPGPNFPWDYFMDRVRAWYDHYKNPRRFEMLVYGKRGTPDYDTGSAAVNAAGHGVATANKDEALAAVRRGETVIAVGAGSARDLGFSHTAGKIVKKGNKVAAVGKDGLESFQLVGDAVRAAL